MKRILPILLLLGIAAGAMGVNPYLMVLARKNASGGCETVAQSFETTDGTLVVNDSRMGSKITAGGNMTVCAVALYLNQPSGDPSTVTIEIWSHDSGNDRPLAKLATTAPIDLGSVPVSAAWIQGDLVSSVALTSGTTYWVGFERTAGTGALGAGRGNTSPERVLEADLSDWSDATILSTSRGGNYRLYTE